MAPNEIVLGLINNIPKADENIQDNHYSRKPIPKRETWNNGIEFLLSCIGMSVGLGNIWMFPYKAYANGGGAFLLPYIIVLCLVGKPIYYLELILGQFSRKGPIKAYDFCPAMRGIGAGQTVAITVVMTFYSSIMAIIVSYLGASFTLPWGECDKSWSEACYPSDRIFNSTIESLNESRSSADLYFKNEVLNAMDDISNGIGYPSWKLTICLLISWVIVFFVILKGVKSSGKASYFIAVFPYVILLVILIKALTLPGAINGIVYFLKPDFKVILSPTVWYEAVTQSFFSLNIGFGCAIMYASFNGFKHNIYRDTMIITTMDTVTSLLAGCAIFGVLGYSAEVTGRSIEKVVTGGPGLSFKSYPDAISKFETLPQLFGVLFFLMLFVLSIGSIVAMASSGITAIRDKFPKVKRWVAVSVVCLFGFIVGLLYITPGGMPILDLANHHGGDFIVFILGIGEVIAVCWIYGMRRFCDDIEFMLERKVGLYWRLCWSVVSPLTLIVIIVYKLAKMETLTYNNGLVYPAIAIVCGWLLTALGLGQVPGFASLAFWRRRDSGISEMFFDAFKPNKDWGPVDPQVRKDWLNFIEGKRLAREHNEQHQSRGRIFLDKLLGY